MLPSAYLRVLADQRSQSFISFSLSIHTISKASKKCAEVTHLSSDETTDSIGLESLVRYTSFSVDISNVDLEVMNNDQNGAHFTWAIQSSYLDSTKIVGSQDTVAPGAKGKRILRNHSTTWRYTNYTIFLGCKGRQFLQQRFAS